jgi:hypothetical protein
MREDMQSLIKPLRPRLHLWVHDAQSTLGYILASRAADERFAEKTQLLKSGVGVEKGTEISR